MLPIRIRRRRSRHVPEHIQQLLRHSCPGETLLHGLARRPSPSPPLVLVVQYLRQRVGQLLGIVDVGEPSRLPVLDDPRRAQGPKRDRREARGHSLDQELPELLPRRCRDDRVGGIEEPRQVIVVVPSRQKDSVGADALHGLRRMLSLPLAGMPPDKHQRATSGPSPRRAEALDQLG
jgi:hypothetical protein